MSQLHVIDHPMIQHKLTIMRKKETGSKDFRELLTEIALLMGYEVTRDLPLEDVEIETPICKMTAKEVAGRKLAIVPILRAGLGMVDGLQTLVPVAKVQAQHPDVDIYVAAVRRPSQRERVYRSGSRRCRRPHLRDQVGAYPALPHNVVTGD